jgi:hypothetical protein
MSECTHCRQALVQIRNRVHIHVDANTMAQLIGDELRIDTYQPCATTLV